MRHTNRIVVLNVMYLLHVEWFHCVSIVYIYHIERGRTVQISMPILIQILNF